MNLENYINGIRSVYQDPTENTEESEQCLNCQMDLTFDEIQEELKNCFQCTKEEEETQNK